MSLIWFELFQPYSLMKSFQMIRWNIGGWKIECENNQEIRMLTFRAVIYLSFTWRKKLTFVHIIRSAMYPQPAQAMSWKNLLLKKKRLKFWLIKSHLYVAKWFYQDALQMLFIAPSLFRWFMNRESCSRRRKISEGSSNG